MKIKCPIFDISDASHNREFENSTQLFRHLMDEHTNHAVSSYLAIKIFKIHEKIERFELLYNAIMDDDLREIQIGIIEELKSLLEDKN